MVGSCIHFWVGVSSIIISPTFKWKKIYNKHCLTTSGGITNFITNTPTILIGYFLIGFIIPISGMQTGLGTCSI
jgi:hypothetical protein